MKATIFLLLATLLFLGSCSIEKRLYNKGWHVDWHRKYRSGQDKTKQGVHTSTETAPHPFDIASKVTDSIPDVQSAKVTENTPLSLQNGEDSKPKQHLHKARSCEHSPPVELRSIAKKELQSTKSRPSTKEEKKSLIIALTILLVLGIFGIIAIFLGLQTTVTLVESIGLLLLLLVLGIVVLILLMVLLATFANSSWEEIDERKNREAEAKKKREEMTPEEREELDQAADKKRRDSNVAIGFIVIVILLIGIVAF